MDKRTKRRGTDRRYGNRDGSTLIMFTSLILDLRVRSTYGCFLQYSLGFREVVGERDWTKEGGSSQFPLGIQKSHFTVEEVLPYFHYGSMIQVSVQRDPDTTR